MRRWARSPRPSGAGRGAWARLAGAAGPRPRRAATWPRHGGGGRDGPPDLDELWRDFNRKLSGLFGGKGGGPRPRQRRRSERRRRPELPAEHAQRRRRRGPDRRRDRPDLARQRLLHRPGRPAGGRHPFGRYSHTVDAGFQWRLPYPFQAHETVSVTQLRSKEVGRNAVIQATGLRDSSMLTQDENIVDIRFTVQYRLKDARAFLFENREPGGGRDAGRRVGGARDRRQEQDRLGALRAARRDRRRAVRSRSRTSSTGCKTGIVVVNVNVQSVQPPEQVQAAFDDTLKAGQDGDRAEEGRPGLCQRRDPEGRGHGGAAARGGRRLQVARRRAGRGRCAALRAACWPSTRRRRR